MFWSGPGALDVDRERAPPGARTPDLKAPRSFGERALTAEMLIPSAPHVAGERAWRYVKPT